MSSRIPLIYSPKILELFKGPKNLGKLPDATVSAQAGSPACGDIIVMYLKINEKDVIEKATFESYGCAANIASASILTEMIKEKTLEEAWKISWRDVAKELGGLPSIKYHCSVLATGALKRAIRKYYKDIKKKKPRWLPEELTREEKQALELEEIIERFYRELKGDTCEQ